MWIGNEYCDVLMLQLLCEYLELRRRRDQHYLRLQRDYSLQTRVKRIADFSDSLCFIRVVAIRGAADKSITRADCKNDLREIWRERNNSIDTRGQTDTSSGIVRNFA